MLYHHIIENVEHYTEQNICKCNFAYISHILLVSMVIVMVWKYTNMLAILNKGIDHC